jgi:hypothetical protein
VASGITLEVFEMKYRKFIAICGFLIIGVALMSTQVGATAPRYMKLVYQPGALQVTILHFSPARSVHYIYKVDIEKNGVLVTSLQYTSQPRFFFFTYSYNVTASPGDTLTATANCDLFGKMTRSITV